MNTSAMNTSQNCTDSIVVEKVTAQRDAERAHDSSPDDAEGFNKGHIDSLRNKTVILQLELTLLKAQRATDRGKIEQLECDVEILRHSSSELVERIRRMGQLLDRLQKLSHAMTTIQICRCASSAQRNGPSGRVVSIMTGIFGTAGHWYRCATLLVWLRAVTSRALRDWPLPEADIFAWIAFGLHNLCIVLCRAPAPAIYDEYPLWAALDM
ncbi:hypothetical protein FKP32DRAFT_1681296 [Trametes sanguinea]|nr:hypothetical protein FKP32DRAFT_1681296 [Trametes sanguinea]